MHLFSNMQLYDHVVTSYVAIGSYEKIWNYENHFYENLLSQKNQTFYKKIYYESSEPCGSYISSFCNHHCYFNQFIESKLYQVDLKLLSMYSYAYTVTLTLYDSF